MKKIILIGIITTISVIYAGRLVAGEINTGLFNNTAIDGYDPVAYYLLGEPKKGSRTFSWEWKGSDWHFISQKHLDLFISDPEKYAPRFGGFCANGLSDGHKVKGKAVSLLCTRRKRRVGF